VSKSHTKVVSSSIIISDFFFLAWQREPVCLGVIVDDSQIFSDKLDEDYELFCDCTAIILIASDSNFAQLSQLLEPLQAIRYFASSNQWHITTLQDTQCKLLLYLSERGDVSLNKDIGQRLDRIRKHGVVGYETSRKLISLLTLIPNRRTEHEIATIDEVPKIVKSSSYYDKSQLAIVEILQRLEGSIESPELRTRVDEIPAKLRDQKFSIGITGVINAGKSTMLNALLGRDILGTSVVPETANLTIIKYAKEPKASVNFWSSDEWSAISRSAETIDSMREFVDETISALGEELGSYITQKSTSIDISIDELPSYTSAKHSSSRCNLVKSVELYTDMQFVQNGVEIVDTPGLDDPVTQREHITREYIHDCDLLCHLMSASQSATQKDIEFIVDTLLHHSVAELLVVITRVDGIDETELEEVIAYTKSSIHEKLTSHPSTARFADMVQRIRFIPIAGKMALLHRTGRAEEALSVGYDLERSGILELESYLSEVLFGDESRKARLIIESAHTQILSIVEAQMAIYTDEYRLLGKDTHEIAQEQERYKEQILQTRADMQRLQERIDSSRAELEEYCVVLKNVVSTQLRSLQDILKRRLYDDVTYEMRKHNKRPTHSRIASMIHRGISDGFIDILRDYRYQFAKRVEEMLERIGRDFVNFSIDTSSAILSAKEFFEAHFSMSVLMSSQQPLIDNINQLITSHSKNQMESLSIAMQGRFEIAMDELYERFMQSSSQLESTLLSDFATRCKEPLDRVEFEISSRVSTLQEASRRAKDQTFDAKQRAKSLDAHMSILDSVRVELDI